MEVWDQISMNYVRIDIPLDLKIYAVMFLFIWIKQIWIQTFLLSQVSLTIIGMYKSYGYLSVKICCRNHPDIYKTILFSRLVVCSCVTYTV